MQALSGLKIAAALVALIALSVACVSFIPMPRLRAYYWHLRHGNLIEVGRYSFPVPEQWYVESFSPSDVVLVDLNTGDSITVNATATVGGPALAAWEELIARPAPGGREKILGKRELHAGDEAIVCVEKSLGTKSITLYPIYCRSEGALDVAFALQLSSARDHDQGFFSLLQQLRKR